MRSGLSKLGKHPCTGKGRVGGEVELYGRWGWRVKGGLHAVLVSLQGVCVGWIFRVCNLRYPLPPSTCPEGVVPGEVSRNRVQGCLYNGANADGLVRMGVGVTLHVTHKELASELALSLSRQTTEQT